MNKQKILAVLIILAAIAATVAMVKLNKKKPDINDAQIIPIIEMHLINKTSIAAIVHGTGTVEANQTLNLTPEINGRVVWVAPQLNPGSFIRKGQLLAMLDTTDYALAVEQMRVQVENALLQIDQENVRATLAKEEWERMGEEGTPSDLLLRKRQQKIAELNLVSARSALQKARNNLERTKIRAPFNAVTADKSIAVGQNVGPQNALARLHEQGNLMVKIAVPADQLQWLSIPGVRDVPKGSLVTIIQRTPTGEQQQSDGYIEGLIGEMDKQTRQAQLLIRIEDPQKVTGIPLLVGSFVEVTIKGHSVDDVFLIPRLSISEPGYFWNITTDSTLSTLSFKTLWMTENSIAAHVAATEQLRAAGRLPIGPVRGMKVIPIAVEGSNG